VIGAGTELAVPQAMKRSRSWWLVGLGLGLLIPALLLFVWGLGFDMGRGCAAIEEPRSELGPPDRPSEPPLRPTEPRVTVVDPSDPELVELPRDSRMPLEEPGWSFTMVRQARRTRVLRAGVDTGGLVQLASSSEPLLDPVCEGERVLVRRAGQLELQPSGELLGASLAQPAAFHPQGVFWPGPEELMFHNGEEAQGMGEGDQVFSYQGQLVYRREGHIWGWGAELGVADLGIEGSWPAVGSGWMAWIDAEDDVLVGTAHQEPVYAEETPEAELRVGWQEGLLVVRVRLAEGDAVDLLDLDERSRVRLLDELDASGQLPAVFGGWVFGWRGSSLIVASSDGQERVEILTELQAIHGLCWSSGGLVVSGRLGGVEGLYRIDTAL
jgi:hypothetical protein